MLEHVSADVDGYYRLHYLEFDDIDASKEDVKRDSYVQALQFIEDEIIKHHEAKNEKLAFRYKHLRDYFMAHPPQSKVN